ncbi:hypothetical protein GWK08_02970 [Leptobacterium flavescens]|uniref:Selenophosphate synthetase n=1 Tax=Leptobacterium flavescens TaxID=472055 RepID=A0A6P0UJ33_9FLAO|nr:hypothetical protein [Leptobacterium flavescens]NER12390.1 hypothetical protein [Leptobacterium flavescens]
MKRVAAIFVLSVLFFSCKTETKNEEKKVEKELTILEKVAYAHGYENWKNVEEIQFSFNVDRDSSHFERNWTWKPKTNDVILKTAQDTVSYNRANVDSLTTNADRGFINDKYWLLAPFNLIWDKGITHEYTEEAEAPIAKTTMHKLTIVYNNEGGYTPGDAYDFYFGDDYLLKEWVFRKGNAPEPSLTTTWENYEEHNGLKLATVYNRESGNWKLYFTNIQVK